MSKYFANYGTVRFLRNGPVRGPSVESLAMPNRILCRECNRYIPRREFPEHTASKHPHTILHIAQCPKCEAREYMVEAGQIGGDCENVLACDYCGEIQIPVEYLGAIDVLRRGIQ